MGRGVVQKRHPVHAPGDHLSARDDHAPERAPAVADILLSQVKGFAHVSF
jgi:hypothetical protein